MKNKTFLWVALVVAILLATAAASFGQNLVPRPGATATSTTQSIYTASGFRAGVDGLRVGTAGTYQARQNSGTCYIWAASNTISASSSATIECTADGTDGSSGVLTGITNGDPVFLEQSSSTPFTTAGGLQIVGASASSSPGTIVMKVVNQTGGTFTWTAAASTTKYWVSRPIQ